VRDRLVAGPDVVFSSLYDDSLVGAIGEAHDPAAAGDWKGLTILPSAATTDVDIDGLTIRYAGAEESAALSFAEHDYAFDNLTITHSVVGLSVSDGGSALLSGLSLTENGIGLLVDGSATPSISASQIFGNSDYGVQNLTPASPVVAPGNWWGDSSGPFDAVGNPSGLGDKVSSGVDYGTFLSYAPLTGCTLAPVNHAYTTTESTVVLALHCPLASEYRLSEDETFSGIDYSPLTESVPFTLSASAGTKVVYAQYRSSDGVTVTVTTPQPIVWAPNIPPTVTITAPAAGATLLANTTISATATSEIGIKRVEFYVNDTLLGTDSTAPYTAVWSVSGYEDGEYTLSAIATDNQLLTNSASLVATLYKGGGDITGPVVTLALNGDALIDGATLTETGLLHIEATDPAGVQGVQVKLNGTTITALSGYGNTTVSRDVVLSFDGVNDGANAFEITASDIYGNPSTQSIAFNLSLAPPSPPTINAPLTGATVNSSFSVIGAASIGSKVQLYIDGTPSGALLSSGSNGTFSSSVRLTAEGTYVLSATAQNARGQSAQSNTVVVTYEPPPPSVSFTSPAAGATLSSSTTFSVSAVDGTGIQSVEFLINDASFASFTSAPYSTSWDVTAVADGSYVLKAVATNGAGKSTTVTRTVTVQKVIVPPPVITPYIGQLDGVSPALSYGAQPITLTGRALGRDNGELITNAPLRILLTVKGFTRRIGIATDSTGAFSFEFIPQESDEGIYSIAIIHPDETSATEQGQFTINRVSFKPTAYNLIAARNFVSSLSVTATASEGSGVTGLRWIAIPINQPSGSLPSGITLDGGSGINIASGGRATMTIDFTADGTAAETGEIIMTALSDDTGDLVRGTLRINYKLVDAAPSLYVTPTYVQTGVQQNSSVSAGVTLSNRGLVTANNVQAVLTDSQGGEPPSWVYLASSRHIGAVEVGATVPLQINANPDASVSDGDYQFRIVVTADNDNGGSVPVSIQVTQDGAGQVKFDVADIYTETQDEFGQTIPGVIGATIRLQNENVLSVQETLTTGADGTATSSELPPGTYVYRASAPNHSDRSGRVLIRPGITVAEHIFLEYNIVNITFSVTETTITDQYDLNLTATYNTQVPAPVVLLEPMSINLPAMQVGEEVTGELTLTNYGLINAEDVTFTPPESDEYYQYEFLSNVPSTLPAKTRITIPYRVTALKLHTQGLNYFQARDIDPESVIGEALGKMTTQASGSCSSYAAPAKSQCYWTCANGDRTGSGSSSIFSHMSGSSCSGTDGPLLNCVNCAGGEAGGWGGYGGGASPIPMAPTCTPECHGPCCKGLGGPPGGPPSGPPQFPGIGAGGSPPTALGAGSM